MSYKTNFFYKVHARVALSASTHKRHKRHPRLLCLQAKTAVTSEGPHFAWVCNNIWIRSYQYGNSVCTSWPLDNSLTINTQDSGLLRWDPLLCRFHSPDGGNFLFPSTPHQHWCIPHASLIYPCLRHIDVIIKRCSDKEEKKILRLSQKDTYLLSEESFKGGATVMGQCSCIFSRSSAHAYSSGLIDQRRWLQYRKSTWRHPCFHLKVAVDLFKMTASGWWRKRLWNQGGDYSATTSVCLLMTRVDHIITLNAASKQIRVHVPAAKQSATSMPHQNGQIELGSWQDALNGSKEDAASRRRLYEHPLLIPN